MILLGAPIPLRGAKTLFNILILVIYVVGKCLESNPLPKKCYLRFSWARRATRGDCRSRQNAAEEFPCCGGAFGFVRY